MQRRSFLKVSSGALASSLVHACARRAPSTLSSPRGAPLALTPVNVSWDRIIRTTVGLRPHRPAGFRVDAERLDEKTVIHNYGHGGSGMSLSWGTGFLATELALQRPERRVAVIGCGIVGLTAARQLQRHGFEVTIYAKALPPETTSNMSWAQFTPYSNLIDEKRRTPAWDAQFRRAAAIAYREHQLLVNRSYGVSWIDDYTPINRQLSAADTALPPSIAGLLGDVTLGLNVLGPGEHPFGTSHAIRVPVLRFEPSIYLDALMRDVLSFGGHIVVRTFESPRDLTLLPEPIIVNCTGLGAKDLFGDVEMIPIKGQLVVLVPQAEVTYSAGDALPRGDGIALGHVAQRGVWSLDVDEGEKKKVMNAASAFFRRMRAATAFVPRGSDAAAGIGMSPPPLEAFLSRVS